MSVETPLGFYPFLTVQNWWFSIMPLPSRHGESQGQRFVYRNRENEIISGGKTVSDLKQYVEKRKARDAEFAENYETGYLEFKIGVLLRQAREEAGLTQEEVAQKLTPRNLLSPE